MYMYVYAYVYAYAYVYIHVLHTRAARREAGADRGVFVCTAYVYIGSAYRVCMYVKMKRTNTVCMYVCMYVFMYSIRTPYVYIGSAYRVCMYVERVCI